MPESERRAERWEHRSAGFLPGRLGGARNGRDAALGYLDDSHAEELTSAWRRLEPGEYQDFHFDGLIVNREPGDTFSEFVWFLQDLGSFFTFLVLAILAWLIYHFGVEGRRKE